MPADTGDPASLESSSSACRRSLRTNVCEVRVVKWRTMRRPEPIGHPSHYKLTKSKYPAIMNFAPQKIRSKMVVNIDWFAARKCFLMTWTRIASCSTLPLGRTYVQLFLSLLNTSCWRKDGGWRNYDCWKLLPDKAFFAVVGCTLGCRQSNATDKLPTKEAFLGYSLLFRTCVMWTGF